MTIAVKYCGGCNPRFDRVVAVARLQKSLPEIEFLKSDVEMPDYMAIVCGCSSRCVNFEGIPTRYGVFTISSLEDIDRVIDNFRLK